MSAPLAVPRDLVERAEQHYLGTGRPLLFKPRGKSEWALSALPGAGGRFAVLLNPECPAGQAIFATAVACGQDDDEILARLVESAVIALAELPRHFECGGRTVGTWAVIAGSVCVSGPVALSCLSWALRERRVGFYLSLAEDPTN